MRHLTANCFQLRAFCPVGLHLLPQDALDRSKYGSADRRETPPPLRSLNLKQTGAQVKRWQKRLIIIMMVVIVGSATGWLTYNLGLDFLLGGRTFG